MIPVDVFAAHFQLPGVDAETLALDIAWVEGMAFPWHFMARFHDERGAWLLDPFHGVVLAPADAAAYLSRIVGRPVHLASPAIAPAGAQPIALRILNNLRNAYTLAEDPVHLRRVLDFQVAVLPQEPELWRERALLQFRLAEYEGASYSVRRYFAVTGRLAVLLESVRQADQPALSEQDRQLRELHRQVNLALARSN